MSESTERPAPAFPPGSAPTPLEAADRQLDMQCMARMARGDSSALADIYDRYASSVYSLALRVIGDVGEAEDVVQEVFAQAWRQAGRYDMTRGVVAAWLLTITRSRAIDRVRARRARPDRRVQRDDYAIDTLPAGTIGADAALVSREDAARVRLALDDLPPQQRKALELAYYEGLSQTEIAHALAEPLGTVKTRVRLGLQKLRDVLSGGTARADA